MGRLLRAIDERLDLLPLVEALRRGRPPGYLSPLEAPPYSLGRVALILVLLLVLSGLGLSLFYSPSAEGAAASLAHLHARQPLGWLFHNVHRWSALLLLVVVVLHALRGWVAQAYRFPRDVTWWVGLGLLLLVIVMGGTGYMLRWDIKAFALMDLVISNLSEIPVVGNLLVGLILGGSGLGTVPLHRGYALHIWFLPFALLFLLSLHLLVVWRQGLAGAHGLWSRVRGRLPVRRALDMAPAVILLILLVGLSAVTPHEGGAGPTERFPWPHPDWLLMFYFIPFWFFQAEWRVLGALILPAALLGFLILAPRVARASRSRTWAVSLAVFGVAGVVWLLAQMSFMGTQVPIQGCAACHRATILGGAPTRLADFKLRDPDWLVFHLREPQVSILTPSESPERP